jgi:hypothetical protein
LSAAAQKLEPYTGVSIYALALFYFDVVHHTVNDPMHEIVNTVKDILGLMSNKGTQRFTNKRRKTEKSFSRFTELGARQRPFFILEDQLQDELDMLVKSLRLPSAWPALRHMFKHLGRMSSSEALLFAGSLGVYLIQFADFGTNTNLKPLLIDLLLALELVQAHVHTDVTLDLLEAELVRVLADLEVILPMTWCSSVRHILLHLCLFIRRCGPFHTFSMLSFERWHTLFKKLARATHHVMSSIQHHYSMVWSSNVWQCPSQGGVRWIHHPFRSTVTGRVRYDYASVVFKLGKKMRPGSLDVGRCGAFVQVQDQWATVNGEYETLRNRYRNDRRVSATKRVTTLPMLDRDWRPSRGPPLTDLLLSWLRMGTNVKFYEKVEVNGVSFRTHASQSNFSNDDSVIKTWYIDIVSGDELPAYGIIQRIFTHSMFSGMALVFVLKLTNTPHTRLGGPSDVIIECEWLELIPDDEQGDDVWLPQVRKNQGSNFNIRCRYTFLRLCATYNILIAPHDPCVGVCFVFFVVYRHRKFVDNSIL